MRPIDADKLNYFRCADNKCDNAFGVKCQTCECAVIYKRDIDNAPIVAPDMDDMEQILAKERMDEALIRAKLIDEWFDIGYNKAKETILGSMKDISTLDDAIRFFDNNEDFAQWKSWLSELKELKGGQDNEAN